MLLNPQFASDSCAI